MADENLEEGAQADDAAADAEDGAEGEGEEKKGGGKKRLLLIIGLVLLLLLGAAAAAYFTGLLDSSSGEETKTEEGDGAGAEPAGPVAFYPLPEMLVNLNTGGRKATILKINVSLELKSAEDVARIEEMMPRIVDNFQVYLRELRIEDLKGSAGMYRLREELLARVNVAVAPTKINAVLFKEMLVQ